MKADDLLLIADSVTDLKTPVFVQSGFNRFEVVTYTIDKEGYILLILSDNANNPKPIIDVPTPKELA